MEFFSKNKNSCLDLGSRKCFYLILYSSLLFTTGAIWSQGISSGVVFNWENTQASSSDPANLKSIAINGVEYRTFAVPSSYELTRLGPGGHSENHLWENGSIIVNGSNSPNWDAEAIRAFQSLNLNHHFEAINNGDNFCGDFSAASTTDAQIHTVSYNPALPSNFDGVLAVTERGGSNCMYLEVHGIPSGGGPEQLLGKTFVRTAGVLLGPAPQAPPTANSDYWSSGRVNENYQVIGIALFTLADLAPINSMITSIKYYAATVDDGDGKFFILQNYGQEDTFDTFLEQTLNGNVGSNDNAPVNSTFTLASPPTNGSINFNGNGSFSYTPNPNFSGQDSFEYTICLPAPNTGVCDTVTVYINVLPIAKDDVYFVKNSSGNNVMNVLQNDRFGSAGPKSGMAITNFTTPTSGNVVLQDNNTPNDPLDDYFTYTPILGFMGTDSFTYEITTSVGTTDTATVTIVVGEPKLEFETTNIAVNESAGTATVNLILKGSAPGFTINFSTQDQSAQAGQDYGTITGSLAFNGFNNESHPITVGILEDSVIETIENLRVVLSNISNTNIAYEPYATVNIVDNDASCSQPVIMLDGVKSASTIGASGPPSLNYSIPAGDDSRMLVVTLIMERDHTCAGDASGDNWGSDGPFSSTPPFTYPIIAFNGVELNYRNLYWQYGGIANDEPSTAELSTETYMYFLKGVDFPAVENGTLTITSNYRSLCEGDETILSAATFSNVAEIEYFDGYGGQNSTAGDTFSTSATVASPSAQPINSNSTDNMILSFGEASTTNGTLSPASGWTVLKREYVYNALGTFASMGGSPDFTENDGLQIFWQYLQGVTGTVSPTVNWTGTQQPMILGVSGVRLISTGCEICDNGIDDDLNGIVDDTCFYISDATATEGEMLTFTISTPSPLTYDVPFTLTYSNVSTDATDYVEQLTVTMPANTNSVSFNVLAIDDIRIENSEVFEVSFSSSINSINIADGTGQGTILDNDGNENYPEDMTVESCDRIPPAATITSSSACAISVVLTEQESGKNDSCPTDYTITRTWVITDCVGNVRSHQQVITVQDTTVPVFDQPLPQDETASCLNIPDPVVLTVSDCDPNANVVLTETITNNGNCLTGYEIMRTWTASDCSGNTTDHTQTITIPPTGPIASNAYESQVTITCGEMVPDVPNLSFTGGCGNYTVTYEETTANTNNLGDYMIIRQWSVTDGCGNIQNFEQIIFVMQPQLQEVQLSICVEDAALDLKEYIPANFDTNGTFNVTQGNAVLQDGILDPYGLDVFTYKIEYTATNGLCKYYLDYYISVNSDCVTCGLDNLIVSKAITVNGDGINDYFTIRGNEYCNYTYDVVIYNRWGAQVFQQNNYQNDWGAFAPLKAVGTSGYLPTGTYYYIISINGEKTEQINGYIYVGTE